MRRAALALSALFLSSSVFALKTEQLTTQAVSPKTGKQVFSSIEVVSQRILVKFAPGTTDTALSAILAGQGATVIGRLDPIGWTVVQLATGTSVGSGIAAFKNLPGVLRVSPDRAYRPIKVPDDPLFSEQTHLSQTDMPAAWEFDTGGTNLVTIAVIDTGIQSNHPDLAAKVLTSSSAFFDPDNGGAETSPDLGSPACEHGTQVAGVAAAASDNGVGVAGVSWGAKLLSLRVFNGNDCSPLNCDALRTCATDDFSIAHAILYAESLENKPSFGKVVMNLSLGGGGSCSQGDGLDPGAVQDAIAVSTTAGIPIAIAAGNDPTGHAPIEMPANCAGTGPSGGVIPVGAVDTSGNLAYFSDVGPELAANGVVAPGEGIVTTDLTSEPDGGYASNSAGTSFASPHVAGLMALVLSAKPASTPAQIQGFIRGGAQTIGVSANDQGSGLVNGFRTMKLAVQGTLANFDGDAKAIAFPNPFRPSQVGVATITVPASLLGGSTTVKIYNVAGEFIKQLNGLTWDGTNNDGNAVASGTYLFEVTTGQGHTTGRLALIR